MQERMVIAALVAALLTVAAPGHSLKAADRRVLPILDQSSFHQGHRITELFETNLYDEDGENGEAENLYVKTDGEVTNQFNITIERSPFERLTILDQVALMVYQLKHVHADWKPSSGIRLRFETGPGGSLSARHWRSDRWVL
jgi:hypothetical protein